HDAPAVAAAAGLALGLSDPRFTSDSSSLSLSSQLLAVRAGGGARPRTGARFLAFAEALAPLSSVGARWARSRAAAVAKETRMKNQNQNLLVAVAIWLACMFGLYLFFPNVMGGKPAAQPKPEPAVQAPPPTAAPAPAPSGTGTAAPQKPADVPRGTPAAR